MTSMRMCGLAASAGVLAAMLVAGGQASATPFTITSPTGGALPSSVSTIGGIVLDLTGTNGNRVVSQVAASTEYVGDPSVSDNPLVFGTQTGFSASVLNSLGGGITAASIRVTLYDGDNQVGNFDYNENTLLANGVLFGNFSAAATQETDSTGTTIISSGFGFGDNLLDTGFFSSTNAATLSAFYTTLSSGSIQFALNDGTPGDQFYDFTQGLDASVINVGSGPVVTPVAPGGGTTPPPVTTPPVTPVPEPAAMSLLGAGILGLAFVRRRNARA